MFQNVKYYICLYVACSVIAFGVHTHSYASIDTNVHHLRVWASPDSTRVVLDLSQLSKYKTSVLTNPHRLIIDIHNAHWSGNLDKLKLKNTGILKITHLNKIVQGQPHCQISFELESAHKADIFMLKPNEAYGYRLVVDLEKHRVPPSETRLNTPSKKGRDFLVVIDGGHGGEDPGSVGPLYGTQEKQVTLAVSRKLEALINEQAGMRAILTRDNDYYLGLRQRMTIARKHYADVFVSIHADSVLNPKVHGAATYVLSQKGASSEAARWLAEHENRSDLIGGVRVEDKSNILASVLLDLSQIANQAASEDLADVLLKELAQVGTLHHRQVQRANFMVLKSPDIPSVLVELGFLSHPEGENKLRDAEHQKVLAKTVFKGIKKFLEGQPSPMHYTHHTS